MSGLLIITVRTSCGTVPGTEYKARFTVVLEEAISVYFDFL